MDHPIKGSRMVGRVGDNDLIEGFARSLLYETLEKGDRILLEDPGKVMCPQGSDICFQGVKALGTRLDEIYRCSSPGKCFKSKGSTPGEEFEEACTLQLTFQR